MGSFGEKRKKNVFSLLSADSRYFQISALKGYFPPSLVAFGKKFVRALVSIKFQQTIYQKKV